MAENISKVPFERIIELFAESGVEFIVIGGQAETLYGSSRVTFDTDLCYRRTEDNLRRLAAALKVLKPTLRGAPPDLPFQLDALSLALGCNFTFTTEAGPLDLLGFVEPLGVYEDFVDRTERILVGDVELQVISLDDLIRIKEHIRRPKDQDSLMHLRAIKRIREE
jgi:predicted nucleotidyltransferase